MCRGGGGDLLYFLCLISNTLPQLEPSSLEPPPVLHHPHLLQTTCYNHLLLLLLLLISRKENRSRNRPFNPLQYIHKSSLIWLSSPAFSDPQPSPNHLPAHRTAPHPPPSTHPPHHIYSRKS